MKSTDKKVLLELTQQCFDADGWLVTANGFDHEPEQARYAMDTALWLSGQGEPIALMEAETGIGKTVGYLVPLYLYTAITGKRAMVATHTIQLQEQMMGGGDLDLAQAYLHHCRLPALEYEQVIGLSHYLSYERLAEYVEALVPPSESDHYLKAAERCIGRDGLVESYVRSVGSLPAGIRPSDICLRPGDDKEVNERCADSRERAQRADIVLTSHMMSIIDSINPGVLSAENGRPIERAIFDEADAFENAAEDYASRKLWPSTLAKTTQELQPLLSPKRQQAAQRLIASARILGEEVHSICQTERDSQAVLIEQIPPARKERVFGSLMTAKRSVLEESGSILKQLNARSERFTDHQLAAYQRLCDDINFLSRYEEGVNRFSFVGVSCSPINRVASLEVRQARPGGVMYRRLVGQDGTPATRLMLTSATLNDGAKGEFESIKWAIAVPREYFAQGNSYYPERFGNVNFLLADPGIRAPITQGEKGGTKFAPLWTALVVNMIRSAYTHGPVLVLCCSYREVEHLSEQLNNLPIIAHRAGETLSSKIDEFQRIKGVLLTPAAWEGVSIRGLRGGQLFQDLVIPRLPIAPPDPYRNRVLSTYRLRQNPNTPEAALGRWLWVLTEGKAVRKVRQGLGRLVRQKSDRGRIWMGDPRFPLPYAVPGTKSLTGFRRTIAHRFKHSYENASIIKADGTITKLQELVDDSSAQEQEVAAWL